jgi:DnaJ like chaperone protein
MSWWGKLFGGALGFALGGPLGAAIGAALGHGFDTRAGTGHPRVEHAGTAPPELMQTVFFTATFAVMGQMAKADGQVTPDEIRMASRVMDRMELPPALRRFARQLFRQGKDPGFPVDEVLLQLRGQTRSRNLLRMFLEIQVFAAYADGRMHASERALLARICTCLGFDAATLAQVEHLVQAELAREFSGPGAPPSGEQALGDAYAMLGVPESADDATVKRAYRRLMSQHHPDKLISKGLPEEMMQLATARTQEIKAAYEFIVQSRRGRAHTP